MKITKKDVEYAARLARLELSEEEKEKYTGQLESVLEYVGHLNKLAAKDVLPTSHASGLSSVWREDKTARSTDEMRERLFANAPEREGSFFKVKKIIE